MDALLKVLSAALGFDAARTSPCRRLLWTDTFLDAVAERVIHRLGRIRNGPGTAGSILAPQVSLKKEIPCPPRDI